MISPPTPKATSMATSLFPTPVGPRMMTSLGFIFAWITGPSSPFAPASRRLEVLAACFGQHRNSPLKDKTGSDIDAAHPQLRRDFQRLRADLRSGIGRSLIGRGGYLSVKWTEQHGASEGSASEAADVGVRRFG